MRLFFKQSKILCLVSATMLIGACTSLVTPVEQIHQAQKIKEPAQTITKQIEQVPEVVVYHCSNDKRIEVEHYKKENVIVSFEGVSHQLSSTVTKNGKKYTNIRWTWHETRGGKAFLYNNAQKTLASNCTK